MHIMHYNLDVYALDCAESPDEKKPKFTERLASALTSLYGRLQAKAGEVTGVKPGAAWIEAMEAGSENGMQQVKSLCICYLLFKLF